MKSINFIKYSFFIGALSLGVGCTNLDEQILDGEAYTLAGGGSVNTPATLISAYNGLRDFQGQGQTFAMNEVSSDAIAGPTRGGDWDDNGAWRQIHTHTWASDHSEVRSAYNSLLSNVYLCNLVVDNSTVESEVNQARFLRAFYYYNLFDLYGQAPYREPKTELAEVPKVWNRAEGTTYLISELEAIVSKLPAKVAGDPSIANQDAARFLLAKLYLNKGVFTAANPVGPYTFDAADMTKVVANVDAMTSTLAPDYWDNFKPTNNTSPELIFVSKNVEAGAGGNMQARWRMCAHYNQTPGGWNGFATISDYYGSFNPTDRRVHNMDAAVISAFGNPAGFQKGLQYAPGGTVGLKDRNGNDLSFTEDLKLITGGTTLETAGIRGMKYIPDANNLGTPENDYVLMRYADALLMKAEAIQRGGSGALGTIAADLAARTAVAGFTIDLSSLDGIYKARGNELWWEGWRRNDMIRFGKYLSARGLKPYTSADKFILYPMPAGALLNPNVKQNPGY